MSERGRFVLLAVLLAPGALSAAPSPQAAALPTEAEEVTCDDPGMRATIGQAMQRAENGSLQILALSGGGQFGAYGAGFLRGWRDATDGPSRPVPFDMVTGTSTGALIATFTFLGTQDDDDRIVRLYTDIKRDADVFSSRFFLKALFKESLTTRNQFRRRLEEQAITKDVLLRVGEEARKGRLLLVGAADIETGCFRYFDLSALAKGAVEPGVTAQEVERIRQAYVDRLMASTAIPVQFAPVAVQEPGDDKPRIYVDGGVRRNLFIETLIDEAYARNIKLGVSIIFNGARGVDRADRARILSGLKVLHVATRSVSMLLDESTEGNLFRVFLQVDAFQRKAARAREAGATPGAVPAGPARFEAEIRFTAIPQPVAKLCQVKDAEEDKAFNNRVIRCLAEKGREVGQSGLAWRSDPLALK